MLPQSHNAAVATTTSEGMSAASGPLDGHPDLDTAPSEEKPAEKTNTVAFARLGGLPSELITLIADHLDIKSLKQLRLCCRKISMALSYTFRHYVPTFLPFFFMQSSMERLALLTKDDRWNKHFVTLEILSSTPDSMRVSEHGFPCWTIHTRRHLHYRRLHEISTHSDPAAAAAAARAAPPRFSGGAMPNVHTLTLCLNCDNYNKNATQHEHLPALYAALPNLTTLRLTHAKTYSAIPGTTLFSGHPLALYTPPRGACRLRRLYIKHSKMKTEELLALMRAHADTLETVEIGSSTIGSLKELRWFVTGDEVAPLLRKVVLEKVDYCCPVARVQSWRWDREEGVVSPDEARNEELDGLRQRLLGRMEAGIFRIRDLQLLY